MKCLWFANCQSTLKTNHEEYFLHLQNISWPNPHSLPPLNENVKIEIKLDSDHLTIPNDGTDVWEIDPQYLKFESKVASGSYGDL